MGICIILIVYDKYKLGKLQTLKVVQDFPSGPEVSALSFNCRG